MFNTFLVEIIKPGKLKPFLSGAFLHAAWKTYFIS